MMISTGEVGSVVTTHLRGGAPAPAVGGTGSQQGQGVQATDGVVLSGQTGLVSRMISALHSLPDVRPGQVQQARTALQTRRMPSSAAVAHQIVNRVVSDRLGGGGGG